MRLFSLNNLPFIIELPFIYKPVNIFKYFNHFMLSERLFKQVKIKFCPATFQSPPISPSHLPSLDSHHFAVGMRIAYLRCICVFIIYMHCQRAQVGSCHLSCTWLTGPPNHPPFSPHPPPPLPAITICWQCTQLLQAIVLCVCTDTEAILHCCIFSNNKIFSAISINLLSPRFREGCAAMVH